MNILPSHTDLQAIGFADPANPSHAAEILRRFEKMVVALEDYENDQIACLEDQAVQADRVIKELEQENEILREENEALSMSKRVYLAGPITGLSYNGAVDWREYAASRLRPSGIDVYSPMRMKNALSKIRNLSADGKDYAHLTPFATPKAVLTRDHNDTIKADAILVNFLGAKQPSLGTAMEIAWAFTRQIPIVVAVDDGDNVHNHMMIDQAIGFRCATLEDAIEITKGILLP